MPEYDVFLSHNSADKPVVEELARRLVKAGFQPWLDTWNLIPGEPWQEAIEKALDSCATCAVFIGPSGTGPWQNEEMRASIDRRVKDPERSYRVIPVLLPGAERGERSKLPDFLVRATWVEFRRSLDDEHSFHRLVSGIRGIAPGPGPGEAIYEGECPYRGLQFFDVKHAPFFFGREALTEWVLNELRGDNRFLAIIGPSGSGKSSLARAGLVAALKRGELPDSDQWPVAICRPGPDPLASLAVALTAALSNEADPGAVLRLIDAMQADQRALHLATRLKLQDAPRERRLVVLVDQFEEIYTLCQDESLRQPVIDNLLYAASVTGGQTVVSLAMRADFYGKCAAYPTLAAALSDHQLLVGPMGEAELRQAIERPAQLAGGEFEPGLMEVILKDVKGQTGSLPLLQYALLELWERHNRHRLTHVAYETIGGVAGALEGRAEAVYQDFNEVEREICRQVFLRLTQPGEGTEDTKRRVAFRDLVLTEAARETVEKVVQTLAGPEVRLVTTEASEGERFVEVAHEALIRNWGRLRNWIDTDRIFLTWHKQLRFALEQWQDKERDEGALLRGTLLTEAEGWLDRRGHDLGQAERDFIQTSVALREREEQQEKEAIRKELVLEIFTQRVAGRDLCGADLQGAYLERANLKGTHLQRANLQGAKLLGADLKEADLKEADLKEVDLQGADLQGAKLTKADLWGADLRQAKLQRANLQGAKLSGADLQGADLQEADLQGADLVWAKLQRANLQGADLQGADLQGADLQGAKLTKADLQRANLQEANLQGANLQGADLQKAKLTKADLQRANLQGAYLRWANLQEANLQEANLQKAKLQKAKLQEANLQKTNLQKTNLQGATYDKSTAWPRDFDPMEAGALIL